MIIVGGSAMGRSAIGNPQTNPVLVQWGEQRVTKKVSEGVNNPKGIQIPYDQQILVQAGII